MDKTDRPGTDAVGHRRGPAGIWWAIHNLIAHPLSEILYWLGLSRLGFWLHDATIPRHLKGTGRG